MKKTEQEKHNPIPASSHQSVRENCIAEDAARPKMPREGSPTTDPCARSELSAPAGGHPAAIDRNTADGTGMSVRTGPVPLYLVPQTISAEIHAHGGEISGISVQRTGQHFYAITLTKAAPRGIPAGDENAE